MGIDRVDETAGGLHVGAVEVVDVLIGNHYEGGREVLPLRTDAFQQGGHALGAGALLVTVHVGVFVLLTEFLKLVSLFATDEGAAQHTRLEFLHIAAEGTEIHRFLHHGGSHLVAFVAVDDRTDVMKVVFLHFGVLAVSHHLQPQTEVRKTALRALS